jgi:PhnB protein
MASLNPSLSFNGNCEAAFKFYKSVFGGEFSALMRYSEMPSEMGPDPAELKHIAHISLPIGAHTELLGGDRPKGMGPLQVGNNFTISITATSEAEADHLFSRLAVGGNAFMPMAKAFWGDYFGMLIDAFGIQWMIVYGYPQHA